MDPTAAAPARAVSVAAVPVHVSDDRRSCRTIATKKPFDPTDQVTRASNNASSPLAVAPRKVPKPARVILGVKDAQDVLQKMSMCRKCRKKALRFSVQSAGVASAPLVHCGSCEEKKPVKEQCRAQLLPATADLGRKKTARQHLTDHAANVLFVLGFLSVGDGGEEAERILGLLDSPNMNTMQRCIFSKVEKEIAPPVIEMAESAMHLNLIDEVSASVDDQSNFNLEAWKCAVETGDTEFPTGNFPRLHTSADMGWQQRRNAHDLLSGHSFLFGAVSRKPMWQCIKLSSAK